MKNATLNRQATIKVARALGDLCQEVVFVGGAMVSLYIDDHAAEDIRPTKDIDLAFQISTLHELEILREALYQKGFREAADSSVICRFRYDELYVDVMSTQNIGWAPGNRWFLEGFDKAIALTLEDVIIRLLPLPYFLATKLDAFFDRGIKDLYASTDLEDLVYLLIHTSDLVSQVVNAPSDVRSYVMESSERILANDRIMNAIPGHVSYNFPDEQMQMILKTLRQLSE